MRKKKSLGSLDKELLKIAYWRWQFLRRNKQFQKEQTATAKRCFDLIAAGESDEAANLIEQFSHDWWVHPFHSSKEKIFKHREYPDSLLLGRVITGAPNQKIAKRPLSLLVSIPFTIPKWLVLKQLEEIVGDRTMLENDPLLSDGKEKTYWIYQISNRKRKKLFPIRSFGVTQKESRLRMKDYRSYRQVWDLKEKGETFAKILKKMRVFKKNKKHLSPESLTRTVKRYYAEAKRLINGGYKTISL